MPETTLPGPLLNGPLRGEAGPDGFRVWVQAFGESPLTLKVFGANGSQVTSVTRTPDQQDWFCVVYQVSGLTEDTAFSYSLSNNFGETKRFHARTALKPSARRVRVAFGSCLGEPEHSGPVLQAVRMLQPNVFIMAGDNAYYINEEVDSDVTEAAAEKAMMATQIKYRRANGFRDLTANISTLAVWDDHDYGPNNAGKSYAHKEAALRCFRRMWANRRYGRSHADPDIDLPGIFSKVRAGPVEIFLLDERFYRTGQSTIGASQMKWLQDMLTASTAPVKLIVSSSQVLTSKALADANTDFDNWNRNNSTEHDQLLNHIAEKDIHGVMIASGDVHLGYLLHKPGNKRERGLVGPDLWELCASRLCGDPWPHKVIRRPSLPPLFDPVVLREVETNNFGFIDVDLDRDNEEIRLALHAPISGGVFVPFVKQSIALSTLRTRIQRRKLAAATWPNGKAYFFRGDRYVRYNVATRTPDPGYPQDVTDKWNGIEADFDTAVAWNNSSAYFFKASGYRQWNIGDSNASLPNYIARRWTTFPGSFTQRVDAAVSWPSGKAYFFKDDEYIRYDIEDDEADAGYPKKIGQGWPGLWQDGIEAIVIESPVRAHFFRGDEYIQWNLLLDRPDPGFPKKVAPDWPGLP